MLTMDSSFWQSLQVPQIYILFYKVFVAYFTLLGNKLLDLTKLLGNKLLDLTKENICKGFCLQGRRVTYWTPLISKEGFNT
jgi:hypothetical protein